MNSPTGSIEERKRAQIGDCFNYRMQRRRSAKHLRELRERIGIPLIIGRQQAGDYYVSVRVRDGYAKVHMSRIRAWESRGWIRERSRDGTGIRWRITLPCSDGNGESGSPG